MHRQPVRRKARRVMAIQTRYPGGVIETRYRRAVLGALVADAASLGLHWIYDPERLAQVAGPAPEFHEPDLEDYRGTAAYFAHPGKTAGDVTHYGEQLLVLLRSLAARGTFDLADYERRFVASFGPGGTWVGYIDFATRGTLRNIDAAERDALAAAKTFDLGAHENERSLMEAKVVANAQRWRGEQLAHAMDKAVRITHGENEELMQIGRAIARAVEDARGGVHGADDYQLPAVSKLPALFAFGSHAVEEAVRATNDNDTAVAWARPVARVLDAAFSGAMPAGAAEAARGVEDPEVDETIEEALAFQGDAVAAADRFGRACPLDQAVPLILALLRRAVTFEEGVRDNIRAGGDSAGRATILGAALGAAYRVPQAWLERTRVVPEAESLLAGSE